MTMPRHSHAVLLTLVAFVPAPGAGRAEVLVNDAARAEAQGETGSRMKRSGRHMRVIKNATGGMVQSVVPPQDAASGPCTVGDAAAVPGSAAIAAGRETVAAMVRRMAKQEGIDPNLALAIAQQESHFSQNARSAAGAIGVMQLMPATAAALGVNPYSLEGNIRGGMRYLKANLDRFGGRMDLAAAAYNAGPNRASLRNGQIPDIAETRNYVRRVSAHYRAFTAARSEQSAGPPPVPPLLSDCSEALKQALDRNSQAKLARARIVNDLLTRSLAAGRQSATAALEAMRTMSTASRAADTGERHRGADGSMAGEVPCPAGIGAPGAARCYRVPSVGNVGAWLAALQRRAQREATLDLMHGEAGAYLAIVRAAPQ